jgi:hypothetical protein
VAKLIVDGDGSSESSRGRAPAGSEWTLLAITGCVFGLVALSDLVLTFVPPAMGSAEWQFGTATQVMNNLPLFAVGLVFVAVAGYGRKSGGLLRAAGVGMLLTLVMIIAMAFFFGSNLAVAQASVTDPVLKQGMSRSVTRTSVQLVAYTVGFAMLGYKALTGARAV